MRFSFLFDTFRLRFLTLYTIALTEGGRERKSFRRCSHRKCHLKDNKVASVDRLWPASPFKVKLKFKLLFKCLRQLTMSAIYPKTDIIITHTHTDREIHTERRRQYETLHAIRGNLKKALELLSSACWTCAQPSPSWGSSSMPSAPKLPMVYGRLWAGRVSIYVGHCTLAEKCIGMPSLTPPGSPSLSYLI